MRFLVVQHLDIEPPALIGETIRQAGHELDTIRPNDGQPVPDTLAGHDGLIVMGGPMSANDALPWINREIALLAHAIQHDAPVLGVCLGAQLLARAAGASIIPSPVRELGWYPLQPAPAAKGDPLFDALPQGGLEVFQWHGETFTLPPNAAWLAAGAHVPNQAFRLGRRLYGLQFHVEVDESIIRAWVDAGESERAHLGTDGVARMLAGTPERLAPMHAFCRDLTRAWLELART